MTLTLSEQLAANLKEYRNTNNLQWKDIYEPLGMNSGHFSEFINGKKRVNMETALQIAALLDKPVRKRKTKQLARDGSGFVPGQSGVRKVDSVPTGVTKGTPKSNEGWVAGGTASDPVDSDETPSGVTKKDSANVDAEDPLAKLLKVYAEMDDLFQKAKAISNQVITVPGTKGVKV
jgi:hypothetical protein